MNMISFLLCMTIILFSSAPLKAEEFNVEVGAFVSANNETVIFQITNYEPFPLACDYIRTNVSYIDSVTHKTIGKRGVRSGKFNVDSEGNEFTIEAGKEVILAFKSQFPNAQVDKIEGPTTYLCKKTGGNNENNEYNEILTMRGHREAIHMAVFSNDGTKMATASSDSTIKIWDSSTGKEITTLLGHNSWVTSVHFNQDATKLVSSSWDSTVKIWDVKTGKILHSLDAREQAPQLPQQQQQQQQAPLKNNPVFTVRFSPDGKTVASGCGDNTIKIWDVMRGTKIQTLMGHSAPVLTLRFSPDGRQIVSGSGDDSVKIWNIKTGVYLNLLGHSYRIFSVAFSPDGTQVLSAGGDATLRLWSVSTGQALKILRGHQAQIFSANFSPDGKKIVSGGEDRMVKIWDAEKGQEIKSITGHSGPISSVAFSPCGTKVASSSHDQTIKIWQ